MWNVNFSSGHNPKIPTNNTEDMSSVTSFLCQFQLCQHWYKMIDYQKFTDHYLNKTIECAWSRGSKVILDRAWSQPRSSKFKGCDVNPLTLFHISNFSYFLLFPSWCCRTGSSRACSLRLDSLFKSNAISSRSAPGLFLHPNNTFSPGRDSSHH